MQSRAKNRQETGARSAQVENLASAGSPRGPLRPSCLYQGGGRSGPRGLGLTVEQSRPIMCLHSFSGLGPLYQRAHWGDGEGGAKKDLKPRYHRESTFMLLAVTEKMQLLHAVRMRFLTACAGNPAEKKSKPDAGLEPATSRLRACHSTD